MLYSAPQSDSSVSTQGRNSAMWRSPAAGRAPHLSSRVSLSAWRCTKSSRENSSASGRPGPGRQGGQPAGLVHHLGEDGEAVLAVDVEGGDHREVVDPGHRRADRLGRLAQGDGQVHGPVADLVAEADGLDRGLAAHRPGQAGHRIGDVEHPGVRADLAHVLAHADQHGDVAQRAVDAAGADGVAHRLADAVAGRHVEVDGHRVEPTGGDGHDHEVGALERPPLVGGGGEGGSGAQRLVDLAGQGLHLVQGGRVDVLQHDVGAAQRVGAEQVGQELRVSTGSSRRR